MKKLLIPFLLIANICFGQALFNPLTVHPDTRNIRFAKGVQITDTLLSLSKIWTPNAFSTGDSNDSIWVKDNVTGFWKLIAQSSVGAITGTPTEVLYFDAGGNVTSDATFTRNMAISESSLKHTINASDGLFETAVTINDDTTGIPFVYIYCISRNAKQGNLYIDTTKLRLEYAGHSSNISAINIFPDSIGFEFNFTNSYYLPTISDSGKFLMNRGNDRKCSWESPTASAAWGSITGTLSNQTDLQTELDAKVPYTGATGDVDLGSNSITVSTIGVGTTAGAELLHLDGGASTARIKLDADNNIARIFSFRTNDTPRWAFRVDGNETGSNAGADFQIRRYNDAGTFIDAPISIVRSTGVATFTKTILPASDDANDLGSDALRFHYLPFKLGSGFLGWGTGGGDAAIIATGSAGTATLTFINAGTGYSFDNKIFPSANNTIPLGIQNTNEFSDAFFGSGAVIGFNNNNMTLTHSAAVLTVGGGDLKVTSAGNASTSVLTTSAVQNITGLKTFADDKFEWNNPATTFQYQVSTSAIGADVVLTLPAFHQNERLAVEDYTGQTTADRTSTSTSLADVTDLAAFSTAASTKYYFSFDLSVTTNATTVGILLSVNHSTAITSISFNTMYPISATVNNVQQNLTALDAGVQPTAGNGATIQTARVWGIMTTNTAGTFALRFASETGAAVVVKAGSTGILSRVN